MGLLQWLKDWKAASEDRAARGWLDGGPAAGAVLRNYYAQRGHVPKVAGTVDLSNPPGGRGSVAPGAVDVNALRVVELEAEVKRLKAELAAESLVAGRWRRGERRP